MMDLAFYDSTYATLNLITAVPINLVEAFTSMFMAILFGRALSRVFQANYHKFWQNQEIFEFNPVKNKVWGYIMSATLVIGSLVGISLLIVYNSRFLDWRQQKQSNSNLLPENSQRDERLITTHDYNDIYKRLHQGDNAVVLVIGKKHWTFIAKNSENETLKEELSNNKFYVAYMRHPDKNLGVFLKQAFLRKTNKQISPNNSSGTPGSISDFDASPFVYINGRLSPVGVTSLKLRSKDIIELSYNDFGGQLNSKGSTSVVGKYYKNEYFKENEEKNQIWIPIVAGLGVFGIILIIIWMPNLINKTKKHFKEK